MKLFKTCDQNKGGGGGGGGGWFLLFSSLINKTCVKNKFMYYKSVL